MKHDLGGAGVARDPESSKVFDGPAADAVLVKLALERAGIRCFNVDVDVARGRLRGAVYVDFAADVERARRVVARHLKGASPSDAVLAEPWVCRACNETIEGQFEACWNCGAPKR